MQDLYVVIYVYVIDDHWLLLIKSFWIIYLVLNEVFIIAVFVKLANFGKN